MLEAEAEKNLAEAQPQCERKGMPEFMTAPAQKTHFEKESRLENIPGREKADNIVRDNVRAVRAAGCYFSQGQETRKSAAPLGGFPYPGTPEQAAAELQPALGIHNESPSAPEGARFIRLI